MLETTSILRSTRAALGIGEDTTAFDAELMLHINNALSSLQQAGCIKKLAVTGETEQWIDVKDVTKVYGNESWNLIPVYVYMKTKVIFDPPPPSNVEYYDKYLQEVFWRIKTAYEEDTWTTT